MAEQLAFGQVLAQSRAVDGDEGLVASGLIEIVDGLGESLFAGPGLAENEHGQVAEERRLEDTAKEIAHPHTAGDQAAGGKHSGQVFLLGGLISKIVEQAGDGVAQIVKKGIRLIVEELPRAGGERLAVEGNGKVRRVGEDQDRSDFSEGAEEFQDPCSGPSGFLIGVKREENNSLVAGGTRLL